MLWVVVVFLVLGAHFALTAIAPGKAGKALFYWPFAKDSQPTINLFGSATKVITQVLSMIAGLCFLASVAALFQWLIPSNWWTFLIIVGSVSSALLFLLYIGLYAILPLIINVVLLLGVFVWHWTVASLRGG